MGHGSDVKVGLDGALRAIFDNALDAICLHQNARHILANPAYVRLFGYTSAKDLVGQPVIDTIAPECREQVMDRIARRVRGEAVTAQYLTRGRRQDGTTFDLEIHGSAFTIEGETYILAILRDVSAAVAEAGRLRESEARMRTLFDSSPDPAWIIEGSRFVECNAAAVDFLGYPSKDDLLFVHPSQISPKIQPDGQPSYAKAEEMIRIAQARGIHRFEWLHSRADESEFLAEVTLSAITLQGRPAIYCTWRDITQRKLAEAEMQLAASVFHTTREGILITDAKGIILSVNPAFSDITGYSAEEAVGQTPRLLKSNHHGGAFYAEMWHQIVDTGGWQGEVWNRRKNGEAYLEWLTISAIPGPDGRPDRFVSVFTDVTELRRKDEQIRHQAYHDSLTGLPNRALLGDRLEHAIEVAQREDSQVAVLFLDLDHFKVVNDSLGHQEGDRLLQQTAQRILDSVRRSDTVGRLGGDEFIVILSGVDAGSEVALVAEKIIAAIAQPFDLAGRPVHAGTSIGIAVFPQDGGTAETLMKNADTAMYQAKGAGRSTFRFFDPSMNRRAVQRLEMEANLRAALDLGEFRLFYQPKIHVLTGRCCGAEALIRWQRADGALVSPADFIPVAEETGLIIPIGYWVIEETCRQNVAWRASGLAAVPVSVNLSLRQFHDHALVDRIAAILAAYGVEAEAIEVELTESAVMEEPDKAIVTLKRLRDLGLKVSVDDFGTGYSSLAYLKRFPISTIKIDRSFVTDLGTDPEDAAIAQTIIALARTLKLDVVAEGVETEGQLAILTEMGCEVVQGYIFGRPVPADDFVTWLSSGR
ncbi:hypothetical protein A6A04_01030 [Paramagnetospirillum marisnigri]|uniref:PAS domain S-box protein n=1 Tax=Paramagnetospirillum marisnigri TaxID=1285242 RepID=A0A178MSD4_9PROT|nr:EAL domain-containing protein [Paramagnetospirillum marisnigri]OAN52308.1 hypothetical protein A6A04_01030 [Paramagnetospirillum marisnigri]